MEIDAMRLWFCKRKYHVALLVKLIDKAQDPVPLLPGNKGPSSHFLALHNDGRFPESARRLESVGRANRERSGHPDVQALVHGSTGSDELRTSEPVTDGTNRRTVAGTKAIDGSEGVQRTQGMRFRT